MPKVVGLLAAVPPPRDAVLQLVKDVRLRRVWPPLQVGCRSSHGHEVAENCFHVSRHSFIAVEMKVNFSRIHLILQDKNESQF